jgi:hypothetical protein
MSYKENCKVEGEIMTKFKIARMYFASSKKQNAISEYLNCHKNTVLGIIRACKVHDPSNEIWKYLKDKNLHISEEKLKSLFSFFAHQSRAPLRNKSAIQKDSDEEKLIIEKFEDKKWGPKRMYRNLARQGFDMNIYSLGKIKGVHKRNEFKTRKIRTFNGERRSLYNYDEIEAFEYLQYDTKTIADKHALPKDIYDKFKYGEQLPKIQWTIIDAKTKTRFLAWSYNRSSTFGLKFLLFVISWLRSHGIRTKINIQVDMGMEFYSGSKIKQEIWNEELEKYNAYAYDTEGVKWKQNIVERSHRVDDEEFYCPRGEKINDKTEFMIEGQFWIIYYNHRPSYSIGLNGISPKEKMEKLGIYNAEKIANFPCLILEDFFQPLLLFFNNSNQKILEEKSQNVLTNYQVAVQY